MTTGTGHTRHAVWESERKTLPPAGQPREEILFPLFKASIHSSTNELFHQEPLAQPSIRNAVVPLGKRASVRLWDTDPGLQPSSRKPV